MPGRAKGRWPGKARCVAGTISRARDGASSNVNEGPDTKAVQSPSLKTSRLPSFRRIVAFQRVKLDASTEVNRGSAVASRAMAESHKSITTRRFVGPGPHWAILKASARRR